MKKSAFHCDFHQLITGQKQAHMGMHLYEDHKGLRGTQSMSGSKLWEDLANNEPTYNIARNDSLLLRKSISSVATQLPSGLNLIDLGPGAEEAIKQKSMRIAEAIQASSYQPVDSSPAFAETAGQIANAVFPNLKTTPTVGDAFSLKEKINEPSLTYFGGSTIGNLIYPVNHRFPEELLERALENLIEHNPSGWTLLSFDSTNDESSLLRTYGSTRCKDFVCNVMYRAAVELRLDGFCPDFFEATPRWIKESHLLASILTATQSQEFLMDGEVVTIQKGQTFPIVNSYKFPIKLFKDVAEQAGISIEYLMTDGSGMVLVLLRNEATTCIDLKDVA